ncbi:YadA-like family protein [[Pasteurella] aerogenes]|nr:YadA-like family protein [[Pasteurella] aerogenes]
MNKIFKVKRNAFGQSVVCSEITKSRTKGHIVASALAVAVAGMMVSGVSVAETGEYVTVNGTYNITNEDPTYMQQPHVQKAINGGSVVLGLNSIVDVPSLANRLSSAVILNGKAQKIPSLNEFSIADYIKKAKDASSSIGYSAIAIGGATIGQSGGLAIGTQAVASGGTAVGSLSYAAGDTPSAFGGGAVANGGATALGSMSYAHSTAAAIGIKASAEQEGAVALGSNSLADTRKGEAGYLADGKTDAAWKSTTAAVSVGNVTGGITRQITSLAAGTQDTDAVNVAQLKAVEAKIGDSINYLSINKTADDGSSLPELDNFNNDGATGDYAVAIGAKSNATGHGAVAIGSVAKTINRTQTVASGEYAYAAQGGLASNVNSIAMGHNAQAKGIDSLALQGGKAHGNASVAVGVGATADADNGITIGQFTTNSGENSVALGHGSHAQGNNSFTFGGGNYANDSILLKGTIQDGAHKAIVLGGSANLNAERSIAIGSDSAVFHSDGIALGAYSEANTNSGIQGYLSNGATDATWQSTNAAMSIGNGSRVTRQLTGLAAGTEDTDAVNVAQLKVVKALADTKVDKDYVDSAIKNFVDSTLITIDDIAAIVNDAGFNITTSDGTTTNHQLGEAITVDGGKNIVTTTDDKGAVHVAMKDDIEVKSVSVEGSTIAITQDGINAGDKKVSHVADGTVAIDSKEAVNGSQLFAVKDTADKAHQTAQLAEVKASDAQTIAKTAQAEAKIAKSTSDKAIAAVEKLNDTAVKYDDSSKDKVTLSGSQGTTIANVKDGAINATSQDAVNGRQLHATNTQVMKNTQSINQLNGRVNQLDGKINKVNKEARAAAAGAHAAAALPQVRGNGKSMMAVSAGSFKGENAIAIGYSRSSDNGKVLLKLHGAANSRGDIGGGVGIGYEW